MGRKGLLCVCVFIAFIIDTSFYRVSASLSSGADNAYELPLFPEADLPNPKGYGHSNSGVCLHL